MSEKLLNNWKSMSPAMLAVRGLVPDWTCICMTLLAEGSSTVVVSPLEPLLAV